MNKIFNRIAVAVGLAAAIGYLAGLMTAPKSGKETREDLKRSGMYGLQEAERSLKNVSGELADLLAETKKRSNNMSDKARKELDGLVASAREAREKAREVITAFQAGNAKDDDLRMSVHQATSALNHLREYLKK
jgi:gas vesicle protein